MLGSSSNHTLENWEFRQKKTKKSVSVFFVQDSLYLNGHRKLKDAVLINKYSLDKSHVCLFFCRLSRQCHH